MAEKLKLSVSGSKKVKMHILTFAIVIIACIAVGYAASFYAKDLFGPKVNCIPPSDLQSFIDSTNQFENAYRSCMSENWNIKMQCEQTLQKYTGNSSDIANPSPIADNLTNSTD